MTCAWQSLADKLISCAKLLRYKLLGYKKPGWHLSVSVETSEKYFCEEGAYFAVAGTFTETKEDVFSTDISGDVLERVCQYMYYKLRYRNTPANQVPEFKIPQQQGALRE